MTAAKDTALAPVTAKTALAAPSQLTREQLDLLKRTIAKGTTDDEFKLFLEVCHRRKVDYFSKLIYPVKRWDSKENAMVMALQSSIDYFRLTAERSGNYAGQVGPYWCGDDGVWVEVWLKKEPPRAARVGVLRSDFKEPLFAIALWDSYVQKNKQGQPTKFWADMGVLMLGKCAEALAIRRAFPEDLAGLYTAEEMAQAEVVDSRLLDSDEKPKSVSASIVQGNRKPDPKPTTHEVVDTKTGEITNRPESAVDAIAEPSPNDLAPPREDSPVPGWRMVQGIPVHPDMMWDQVREIPFGGKNRFLAPTTPSEIADAYMSNPNVKQVADRMLAQALEIYGEHKKDPKNPLPSEPYQKMALAVEEAMTQEAFKR